MKINKKGFTLMELLAVIGIIGIIMVLLVPNVIKLFSDSKKSTFITEVRNVQKLAINQREINIAEGSFTGVYNSNNTKLLTEDKKNFDYIINFNNNGDMTSLCVSNGSYALVLPASGLVVNPNDINVNNIVDTKFNCTEIAAGALEGSLTEGEEGSTLVIDYLVNAIEQPYKSNIAGGPIYNEFVGKYVKMDDNVCFEDDNNNEYCGLIPNPYDNSLLSAQNACSLTTEGELSTESTGNCNINTTSCSGLNGYTSSLENWRIMYIEGLYDETDTNYINKKENANIWIVSSKSVECVNWESNSNVTVLKLNTAAQKYCNDKIVEGTLCKGINSNNPNVRSINNEDFENISKYTRGKLDLTINSFKDLLYCRGKSVPECFNLSQNADNYNSLINNNEIYWFASSYSSGDVHAWWPSEIAVGGSGNVLDGLRPALKLKAGIKYVVDDAPDYGTSTNPYRIVLD